MNTRAIRIVVALTLSTSARGAAQGNVQVFARYVLDSGVVAISIAEGGTLSVAADNHHAVAFGPVTAEEVPALADNITALMTGELPNDVAAGYMVSNRCAAVSASRNVRSSYGGSWLIVRDETRNAAVRIDDARLHDFLRDLRAAATEAQRRVPRDGVSAPQCHVLPDSVAQDLVLPMDERTARVASALGIRVDGNNRFASEEPVSAVRGTIRLSYPLAMRAQLREGKVLADFMVDSTGSVDLTSLRFLASSGQEFSDAVRDALRRAHYVPARVNGQKIRLRVQQPFTFSLSYATPDAPPIRYLPGGLPNPP